MSGDRKAERAAKRASDEATRTRQLLDDERQRQREKEAREAQRAQRIMLRSMRAGGGGFFSQLANNPVLGESSEVLG